jgi:hypothetical protein
MKQPTAPPEQIYPDLSIEQNESSNFRLFEIRKLEGRLETERDLREKLYKKYRRAINVIDGVDATLVLASLGLGATGVGLLSTIIAAPIVIPLEVVAIGCGLVGVGGKFISRKLLRKAKKHDDIRVLAISKLNSISDLVSKAIQDQQISSEEYSLILAEWKKYLQMKKDIRSKTQQEQTDNQDSTVSKNEMLAQARQQIMKELSGAASK